MPSLVIKNLPKPIHDRLQAAAKHNRRSVTQQAILELERRTTVCRWQAPRPRQAAPSNQARRNRADHPTRSGWQAVIFADINLGVAHGALLMSTRGDTSQITLEELLHTAGGGSARIKR